MTPEIWDFLLLAAVSVMVTIIAYLRHPLWKAFVLSFPLPFTLAALAVGEPLGAANVMALGLLFLYTYGVYLLRNRLRLNVLPAILLAAGGYCLVGVWLQGLLPKTESAFWLAVLAITTLAVLLRVNLGPRSEPGFRASLPLFLKLPVVLLVVTMLILLKSSLGGFMTLFPMVGVLASYKSRFSLWSNVRQVPVIMLTLLPLMVTSRLLHESLGLAASLGIGWVPFLLCLTPFLVGTRSATRLSGGDAGAN
ncbi:MAG: hypothetical protein WD273_03230 [Trueperaceae bacterium]